MTEQSHLVPKRRFKEFQNADAWEQRRLGDLINYIVDNRGKNPKYYCNEGIPVIDNFMIRNNCYPNLNEATRFIDDDLFDNFIRKYNEFDDVLITLVGNGIGNITMFPREKSVVIQNTLGLRFGNDKKFMFYSLMSKNKNIIFLDRGMAQPSIRQDELLDIDIELPSGNEQTKISEFFYNIDNLITLHQRKLEKTKALKSAYLSEMFPAEGECEPKRRFPGFTGAWEQRELGELANFTKGTGYTKNDLRETGSPIILYGRLYTNYKTLIEDVDTFVDMKEKSVISLGGEVILPSSGESAEDIARASVVGKPGIILGGDLNIIKPNEQINPVFLALAISNGTPKKDMSKRAQGKSVVHLHNSDLKNINLIFPQIEEQRKIVELIMHVDHLITLHQRKLEKLQNLKKAYLNEMFV